MFFVIPQDFWKPWNCSEKRKFAENICGNVLLHLICRPTPTVYITLLKRTKTPIFLKILLAFPELQKGIFQILLMYYKNTLENNFTLTHLTYFFSMFPFDPPEKIRKSKFSWYFQEDKKRTLGRQALWSMCQSYRNYATGFQV